MKESTLLCGRPKGLRAIHHFQKNSYHTDSMKSSFRHRVRGQEPYEMKYSKEETCHTDYKDEASLQCGWPNVWPGDLFIKALTTLNTIGDPLSCVRKAHDNTSGPSGQGKITTEGARERSFHLCGMSHESSGGSHLLKNSKALKVWKILLSSVFGQAGDQSTINTFHF